MFSSIGLKSFAFFVDIKMKVSVTPACLVHEAHVIFVTQLLLYSVSDALALIETN